MNPLKQGLKPATKKELVEFVNRVKEVNPLKQGLKLEMRTVCRLLPHLLKK